MPKVTKIEQRSILSVLDILEQPNGIANEVTTEVEDQLDIVPYEPAPPRIYHATIPNTDVATSDLVDYQSFEMYGGCSLTRRGHHVCYVISYTVYESQSYARQANDWTWWKSA